MRARVGGRERERARRGGGEIGRIHLLMNWVITVITTFFYRHLMISRKRWRRLGWVIRLSIWIERMSISFLSRGSRRVGAVRGL